MCNRLGRGRQGVCFGYPPNSSLRVARFALHEPQERFGIVMIPRKLQDQRELTASPLRLAAPTEQLDELKADVVEGRTQTHSSFELRRCPRRGVARVTGRAARRDRGRKASLAELPVYFPPCSTQKKPADPFGVGISRLTASLGESERGGVQPEPTEEQPGWAGSAPRQSRG